MASLVEMIKTAEESLSMYKEQSKKLTKEIAALMEERENVNKNIDTFEDVVAKLTAIKDNEVRKELGEKPEPVNNKPEKKKRGGKMPPMKVVAIDANGDKIAEYRTQTDTARDLNISQASVRNRIFYMSREEQIEKYGFALKAD